MSTTKLHFLKDLIRQDAGDNHDVNEMERLDLFRLTSQVSNEVLNQIDRGLLDDLRNTFGESITVDIGYETDSPLIQDSDLHEDYENILRKYVEHQRDTDIRIEVNKDRLSSHLGVDSGNYRTVIYLFVNRALKAVDQLFSFKEKLFPEQYRSTLLIVFGSNASHVGPLLNVADLDTISDVEPEVEAPSRRTISRIDQYRERVGTELNWTSFDLDVITPLHFMCRPTADPPEPVDARLESCLRRMLFHSSLLYTADRTESRDNTLAVTFAGSEGTAEAHLGPDLDGLSDSDLVRFARWPYMSIADDRLNVLRTVMVRELRGMAKSNYDTLTTKLRKILEEARWHYRLFIDERIEDHFRQIKEVSDYISSTTRRINNWVESMTSNLVNTLLATLGLVLITILGSVFKQNNPPIKLIEIGLTVYAIYIFALPGLYRMSNTLHSYILLMGELSDRKNEFIARLGFEKVTEKMSSIRLRKWQFWVWFVVTSLLYVATSMALLWLSWNVDSILSG